MPPSVKYSLIFILMFFSFQPVLVNSSPCVFELLFDYFSTAPEEPGPPQDPGMTSENVNNTAIDGTDEDNSTTPSIQNTPISGVTESESSKSKSEPSKTESKSSKTESKSSKTESKFSKMKEMWGYMTEKLLDYSPVSVLAVILSCMFPVMIVYGIFELFQIKKTLRLTIKKPKSELKEGESQTSCNSFALMDEINSVTEAALIFSQLKKLSFELLSDVRLRDAAREILTDEFLHVVAARISGDADLKNTLPLLQPETLLKMGQMYQEVMAEQQDFQLEGENKALRVNLDFNIDGKGGIQLTDSGIQNTLI